MESERFHIVYDTDLKRPACALLQAIMGGDMNAFNRFFGGHEKWLIAPTPGMKLISGTEAEWKMAKAMTDKVKVKRGR